LECLLYIGLFGNILILLFLTKLMFYFIFGFSYGYGSKHGLFLSRRTNDNLWLLEATICSGFLQPGWLAACFK
jgi:hypothetical protein